MVLRAVYIACVSAVFVGVPAALTYLAVRHGGLDDGPCESRLGNLLVVAVPLFFGMGFLLAWIAKGCP
jgi:hypothetical protein